MSKKRANDWLHQAQNDLLWAKEGINSGFYSQVCFMCQQAAEKAIKSIAYFKEYEIRGHSIAMIAKSIGANDTVENAGRNLDLYYISSRYPDALPDGAPCDLFTKEQAQEALKFAQIIIDRAFDELK
ncbi:MAG: HEPN domain-containing protein [Bacteriovoracaceae bacterium]|nr:HEPN domain-containing protein [Bacteriovoracaceae bacterium]